MIKLNPERRLRNSLLISLALHIIIFTIPSANFRLLLPQKKSKLIEVSLLKMLSPSPPREEIKENPLSENRNLPERTKQSRFSKAVFEKTEEEKESPSSIPKPTEVSPERIVEFQGYSVEAVRAIFKRYGMKYEKYTPGLDRLKTTGLVNAFTIEGNQLGNSRKGSLVSFAGEPIPGSMVLVIPPKVYLAILEAERKELRKRGLPLTTPLKKVVFGIGQDEQGNYALVVKELNLRM